MLAVQALADAFAPGASPEACASLAQTLAQVAREDEPWLLEGLAKTDVVARAIAFAQSEEADQKVLQSVLASLVNLAAMGGVVMVKKQGGFDFLVQHLKGTRPALVYFATAGVQNMMADDECVQQAVHGEVDVLLEQLLEENKNAETRRFASGALVNIIEAEKRMSQPPPPPAPTTPNRAKAPGAISLPKLPGLIRSVSAIAGQSPRPSVGTLPTLPGGTGAGTSADGAAAGDRSAKQLWQEGARRARRSPEEIAAMLARAKTEREEQDRRAAEQRAQQEAEERAKAAAEEQARLAAEAKAKAGAEAQAAEEAALAEEVRAAEQARLAVEEKKRLEAEAKAQAKAKAEAKAAKEAKAAADAKAAKEAKTAAEAKATKEAKAAKEAKTKAETAKRALEEKSRQEKQAEAEAKAAERKLREEQAAEKARLKAEEKARAAAEAKAAEEARLLALANAETKVDTWLEAPKGRRNSRELGLKPDDDDATTMTMATEQTETASASAAVPESLPALPAHATRGPTPSETKASPPTMTKAKARARAEEARVEANAQAKATVTRKEKQLTAEARVPEDKWPGQSAASATPVGESRLAAGAKAVEEVRLDAKVKTAAPAAPAAPAASAAPAAPAAPASPATPATPATPASPA